MYICCEEVSIKIGSLKLNQGIVERKASWKTIHRGKQTQWRGTHRRKQKAVESSKATSKTKRRGEYSAVETKHRGEQLGVDNKTPCTAKQSRKQNTVENNAPWRPKLRGDVNNVE